jgi:hypothetical protein
VLPKLLRSKRTHPATEPVPDGWVPCAHFYPSYPAKDAMGEPRPFDHRQPDAFQRLIEMIGSPESAAIKKQVTSAVLAGQSPFTSEGMSDRVGRISVQVALRQMKASGTSSRTLLSWLEAFDRADHQSDDEDDASRQHGH